MGGRLIHENIRRKYELRTSSYNTSSTFAVLDDDHNDGVQLNETFTGMHTLHAPCKRCARSIERKTPHPGESRCCELSSSSSWVP